jgi:hypothetical protein
MTTERIILRRRDPLSKFPLTKMPLSIKHETPQVVGLLAEIGETFTS